jgi:hypothetical protein
MVYPNLRHEINIECNSIVVLSPLIGAKTSPFTALKWAFRGQSDPEKLASELLLSTLHSV